MSRPSHAATSHSGWHPIVCAFCGGAFAFKQRPTDPPCVACPDCGRYQPEMLEAARDQRYLGFTLLGGLFALVGVLAAAAHPGVWAVNLLNSPAVLFQLVALGLFVAGRLLAGRCDPNADAESRMDERCLHVLARREFEAVRLLAKERGVPMPALDWRSSTLAATQPPARLEAAWHNRERVRPSPHHSATHAPSAQRGRLGGAARPGLGRGDRALHPARRQR